MNKTKRKKQEQTKRRFEAIKDMMSTFAMSTVAVVAAVTLIPASPKAEITKAVSLSEEIVYQVTVTDEDNALDLDSLYVVLENQLEYYEHPLQLGEQSGHFEALKTNTQYRLSVYGNKGFGQERLDTMMITTRVKVGGTILSVTPEETDHMTSYMVDVSIYDPDLKYSDITLYYGYSWEHDVDEDIVYTAIPITESRITLELTDIFTSEPFHLYLEGTTVDGPELLDELWVTPPFELYASVYQEYVNSHEVGFSVYGDMDVGDITYHMDIYTNDRFFRSDSITLDDSGFHGSSFVITTLSPNTTYYMECTATYTNPLTLREEQRVIFEGEVTTLDEYVLEYSTQIVGEYLEVTISMNDPNHYFQQAYYDVYDTSEEMDIYMTGETIFFESFGETKGTTFQIRIPATGSVRITIGIRNEFDFMIQQKIDVLYYEQGEQQ